MCPPLPVELLRRQYLQHIDPDSLRLPSLDALRLPETQKQIYNTMFSQSALSYPLPNRYQYRVLKRLIGMMEQAIEDPDEDVLLSLLSGFTLVFSILSLKSASPTPSLSLMLSSLYGSGDLG